MLDIDKQYVFNEQGEAIAVQIPLEQFQQIEQLLRDTSQQSSISDLDESKPVQPEAELEYVNGVPVIKSYGGKILHPYSPRIDGCFAVALRARRDSRSQKISFIACYQLERIL